ncbi:cytochrome c biogenesis protein CcsA [Robiginitalea sp. M366]|uniref:cytochrome c biogenesis protein CcsA n=1 Tax=Robiginitalea aestuariiviva TaxID=3036903 RepID=UPI00240DD6B3|nr:cytochrome c biogenesis protein CcsA [Robiginitalea aestuariiviva]MDG1572794.1 cytochrome c biogenesis protein CcsA [Robiginitalea aestuariiviva]
MLKSLERFLFSTRLMAILFIVMAAAMAFGTFIESWYSTQTAKIWIYNAWWFEAIMLFFLINFIGNISRYRLLRKEKWAVLLLHLSWVLIIVGAFITRYISYEGSMPIREGETENVFYSEKTYLSVLIDGEIDGQPQRKELEDDLMVTEEAIQSSLPWKAQYGNQSLRVDYLDFVSHARMGVSPDPEGTYFLKLVEAGGGERHDHYLQDGALESIHNVLFSLNREVPGAVNIRMTDSTLTLQSPFGGSYMRMADQQAGTITADSVQPLMLRSLYTLGSMQFVIPDPPVRGSYQVQRIPEAEQTDNDPDALRISIEANGQNGELTLLGGKGRKQYSEPVDIGGLRFRAAYGSKVHELPFSITLNDFIAEKYPGTEKGYASYMSKITVRDSLTEERPFDYDIFMNHVLDHQGYRFFQASFFPDEQGTVLSVNHDFWGTWVTYIGYFLLYIGLMGIMFFGKTRFRDLARQMQELSQRRKALSLLLLLGTSLAFGQQPAAEDHQHNGLPDQSLVDSLILATAVPEAQAREFGHLVIQDDGGRMKPVNTFASELLRKISFKDHYNGLTADQVLLSMIMRPNLWTVTEFIALDKKSQNDSIRHMIGVPEDQKSVRLIDFFDAEGRNKLEPVLEDAFSTTNPNKFQQDFKDTYLRLGLLNRALSGEILKIFPLPDHPNNKWISSLEYKSGQFAVRDSLYGNFIKNAFSFYLMNLEQGVATGDFSESSKILAAFRKAQEDNGAAVMPSREKVATEVIYNRLDIFNRLYRYYALTGMLLFFILIFRIFRERRIWDIATFFFKGTIIIFFIWHTAGLVLRWYISGHAPWSDAYESILYVAWACMGMGLLLGRRNDMTIAASAFVTSMLLWIAHQSWVDPAIANLQPVLNSYWLMIHVAVIVASYGPLTVGMVLGVVSLLLIIMTTEKNRNRMQLHLKELTVINELALTVGLVMLTIGNFLGGQWANESWGRYWGWDPKETWALISILVYAFVIHTRLVPGLRGRWTFNFLSIVAFASIMMTYFGVNFYLVGLHSYASGSQVITPTFVWYTVAGVLLLGAISWWRNRIYYRQGA